MISSCNQLFRSTIVLATCVYIALSGGGVFAQDVSISDAQRVDSLVCQDAPDAVRDEIVSDFGSLYVGGGMRFTKEGKISTLQIVKNTARCEGGFCRSYVSYMNGTPHGCVFEMATYLSEKLFINSSIISNDPIAYNTDCTFYYRGFCFQSN